METNGNKRHWSEMFRIITPFLLLVITFIGGTITKNIDELRSNVKEIDTKIFHHLTNDEIHIPRTQMVEKASFDVYCKMHNEESKRIYDNMNEIKEEIRLIRKSIETVVLTNSKNGKQD